MQVDAFRAKRAQVLNVKFSRDFMDTFAWHYTTGNLFIEICDRGAVLPAKTSYGPIVWFSTESLWEPTALQRDPNLNLQANTTGRLLGQMAEICRQGGGLVRLGVSLSSGKVLPWLDVLEAAGFPYLTRRLLETADEQSGGRAKRHHFGMSGEVFSLADIERTETFDWNLKGWALPESVIERMPPLIAPV